MNKIKIMLLISGILELATISYINVNAVDNKDNIPTMTLSQINNRVQINWATEILDTDLIWHTGFEEGDYKPSGLPSSCNTIDNIEHYTGLYSVKVTNSALAGVGNFKYPAQDNWTSRMVYNSIYRLQPGMKFSASVKVKNTGDTSSISLIPESTSITKYTKPFHKVNGIAQPIIVGADTNGSSFIPIENFDYFNEQMTKKGQYVVFVANKVGNNYDATSAHIYPANIDTVNKGIKFGSPTYYKKGEELQYLFFCYPLKLGGKSISSGNDWLSFNFNGTMQDLGEDYDIANKGIRLIFETKNIGSLYIDDFKLGHATKVRLYKDNKLIYEGYESQLNDTSATDKTKPNSISNIKSTMKMIDTSNSKRKITVTFDKVKDNGTKYNYQISAVSKSGIETPKSETKTMEVISGINGYSYVIDKNPNTNPSNTVNLTTNSIEKDITDSGTYYLHIKAIDNAGNVSEITHHKIDIPTLTTKAKPKDNYIRLDWTMNDKNNKIFKIYQKKEGSDEFQTIGATNFEDTKQVKVLNVHPNTGGSETFTTWKDETLTLPPSARLKKWMEEPNKEHPKGYGKGLIEVTPVTIENFNANPDSYLKDSDGSYKYDVIMFGSWDAYLDKDLNTYSLSAVKSFIDTGRGVLVGHDVIRIHVMPMFNELRTYMNIEIPGDKNIDNAYSHAKYWLLSRDILKKREGLLTNYPWVIDKSQLTVPLTHSSVQWAYGDIWFEFTNIDTTTVPHFEGIIYNGLDGRGTNNHYLTTWNNTAMIQTGHSNGQATSDEQKILANTLFYLNQLSTDNFLNDYSGQDVKAPDKPVIYEHNFTDDGFIDLKFNEVKDNGNKYSYYVQSEDKQKNISVSNVVNETIISGIKGYSFIVDEKPDTVPDNVIEQSDNKPIRIKTNSSKELYVHIKAIDNAGNSSETYHYRVTDMTKPTMNLTLRPNTWTNGFVTIDISATDNESGIKYIILPNGSIIKGNTGSYNVTDNGKYYFKAVDYMGNETISSIIVSNIDKKKPNVTINNNQNWTNQDVQVTITSTDD